jgi:CIC family chloride channel protein
MVEQQARPSSTPVTRKYWRTLSSILTGEFLTAREEQFFLILAIIIGIFSGLAVVCFRVAIESARLVLLGSSLRPSFPRVVLIPCAIGLVVAILVVRFFPRARGSGVNQTKGALYIYDGYIAGDTVIGKFITSALAIGSGQSLGPEDPSLQIGAGLASFLGRKLRLSRERLRLIAPVGAAAGLAAAFNSPITAVLFVIEEVVGRWSAGILGAIVLSAISSVVVERWFLGDAPLFRIPQYHLAHPEELLAYAGLGVVGGFASLAFVKLIAYLRPRAKALPAWTQYFQPAVAGLIIGSIGIWYPQVMGAGYDYMDQAMHGQFPWKLLFVLAGFKILATSLSFSSGTPGGLFAPTLFIGAMIGGGVGMLERALFPQMSVPVGAYALVGMGTLFAGILRAPLTSVFMILEVSGNYSIILPVIISNAIAYFISRSVQKTPIFDLLSRQDGLDLPSLEEERELEVLRVEDAMEPRTNFVLSGFDMLTDARQQAEHSKEDFFLVQMASGNWAGITKKALLDLRANDQAPLATAVGDMLPRLHPDHPLDQALRMIGDWPMLPVVHRADYGTLLGVLTLENIITAYRTNGLDTPVHHAR